MSIRGNRGAFLVDGVFLPALDRTIDDLLASGAIECSGLREVPTYTASTMTMLQTAIGSWARNTFPDNTAERIMAHLRTEVAELSEAVVNPGATNRSVDEELADVAILLLSLAEYMGINLRDAIRRKHEKNLDRTFAYDESVGFDRHIEEQTDTLSEEFSDRNDAWVDQQDAEPDEEPEKSLPKIGSVEWRKGVVKRRILRELDELVELTGK